MRDPVSEKYLGRYAHPVALGDVPTLGPPFRAAVVVPAYDESPEALGRLLERMGEAARDDLVILVVNQPRGASPEARAANHALVDSIRSDGPGAARARPSGGGPLSLYRRATGPAILLVDLSDSTFDLDPKEGVGVARKVGMDLALRLHLEGTLVADFVGSSDMDARLPTEYFDVLARESFDSKPSERRASALLFPYCHLPSGDPDVDWRMSQVEATFRYYVLGLWQAGSPYAYHSLGSALGVSLFSYARARGFPRRSAGEDFYLLNKLGRLRPLRRLNGPRVEIQTRISDRVPFGTGPALRRAIGERRHSSTLLTYHPESFRLLGCVLDALAHQASLHPSPDGDNDVTLSVDGPPWVKEVLHDLWLKISPTLPACPSARHRMARVHESLDALGTLKFIHRAHREGLPEIPVEEAISAAGFAAPAPWSEELLATLRCREEDLPEWVGPARCDGADG